MKSADLIPLVPSGVCRFCRTANFYSENVCDKCGCPLPWADGVADQLTEGCPTCAHFCFYTQSICPACKEQLPWAENVTASSVASRHADSRWRSLAMYAFAAAMVGFLGTISIRFLSR